MSRLDQEPRSEAPDGRPQELQPSWRRDFPIDTAEDDYVARRDFTKLLVLTSLAFTAGQVCIGIQNLLLQRRGELPVTPVACLDETAAGESPPCLRVGEALLFHYPDATEACLLLRPDANTLVAYNQKCTHLSCPVAPEMKEGHLGNQLHCPCHHGVFDVATGRPISGPPRRPLTRINLKVVDHIVYATGVEARTV